MSVHLRSAAKRFFLTDVGQTGSVLVCGREFALAVWMVSSSVDGECGGSEVSREAGGSGRNPRGRRRKQKEKGKVMTWGLCGVLRG